MKDLKDIRVSINQIDQQMATLFEQRMHLAKDVAMYKIEKALPIVDKNREDEVIKRNLEYIKDEEIKPYYVNFLKDTMEVSKRYQSYLIKGMKVAYSGEPGAFAHIACNEIFPNANYIAYPNFKEAYNAVENGLCDTCVLPIENSFAGDVGNVMDLIFNGNLYITQMYNLTIKQNLIGKKGTKLADVKTVISHPQALEQCKEYIANHHFNTIECVNTAVAAKRILEEDHSVCAIASSLTSSLYGLEIIEKDINTLVTNTTRFAVFSRTKNLPLSTKKMGEHFVLVFTVVNESGALAQTLNIIGSHGFNMRNLRSRPLKGLMWTYYFFVELEGNVNTDEARQMLLELGTVCDRLKMVGTYFNGDN